MLWAETATGLRGSFLCAGASCVVTSVCPVYDEETMRFMIHMYATTSPSFVTPPPPPHFWQQMFKS